MVLRILSAFNFAAIEAECRGSIVQLIRKSKKAEFYRQVLLKRIFDRYLDSEPARMGHTLNPSG